MKILTRSRCRLAPKDIPHHPVLPKLQERTVKAREASLLTKGRSMALRVNLTLPSRRKYFHANLSRK